MTVNVQGAERAAAPRPAAQPVMSTGAALCRVLEAAGVRRVYTVPGESFLEVLDEANNNSLLTLISTRHESGAAFMAEADAKLTGVPAVAAGTRGVGAANLAIGVHTAYQDSTPMIALIGQVETEFAGREAFQEVDLPAFYAPITKWAATVNRADRLPELLARGIVRATTGRPGPVMLALPADMLRDPVPVKEVEHAIRVVSSERSVSTAADADVRKLVDAISRAERPVMVVGNGTREASRDLVELAQMLGVGVYTAFRRQDTFPNDHPLYLGHLTLGAPPAVLAALEAADLVVVLGARLDEITTQGYRLPTRQSRLIHVDAEPFVAADGLFAAWSVPADASSVVRAAAKAVTRPVVRDWSKEHGVYLKTSTPLPRHSEGAVDPVAVIAAMSEILPADAIVTSDAGNFSAFLHLYWKYAFGRSQLAPVSGAMGYGVPAAVAAALAGNGRLVVGVCGDGGFLMSGQELETAVRYGLDLLVIVMRNGLYGTIAMHQARTFGRTSGVDIGSVDLAAFARSLGAFATTVRTQDELVPQLRIALETPGVRLLDVQVDPDLISPFSRLTDLANSGAAALLAREADM
jgi:acetolactate synthase-1/2/3 large subunit